MAGGAVPFNPQTEREAQIKKENKGSGPHTTEERESSSFYNVGVGVCEIHFREYRSHDKKFVI